MREGDHRRGRRGRGRTRVGQGGRSPDIQAKRGSPPRRRMRRSARSVVVMGRWGGWEGRTTGRESAHLTPPPPPAPCFRWVEPL